MSKVPTRGHTEGYGGPSGRKSGADELLGLLLPTAS